MPAYIGNQMSGHRCLIDKVSFTLEITNAQFGNIKSDLQLIAQKQKESVIEGKVRYLPEIPKYKHPKSGKLQHKYPGILYRVSDGAVALMHLHYIAGHFYMRWTLWPHRCTGDRLARFHEVLTHHWFDYMPLTYTEAFAKGRVTYMEVSTDILVRPESLIFWRKRSKVSDIFVDSKGKKGTCYIGSNKSDLYFRVYDKARQLKETQNTGNFSYYTRAEAVLQKDRLKIPASELQNIPNPFLTLYAAFAIDCKNLDSGKEWQEFLNIVLEKGSPTAFAGHDEATRKKFARNLTKCAYNCWQPQKFWLDFPAVASKITPKNLGLIMDCN